MYKDKEKERARSARYRALHKEKLAVQRKEHQEKNKEEIKIKRQEYAKLHPEEVKTINNRSHQKHKIKSGIRAAQRRQERRQYIIDLHSGHCVRCGYKRNIAALDFHHLDPNEKESNQGVLTVEEADKCILLCATCHREHHNGGIQY